MARVGYARVSSVGQSLEVQLDKLKHCDKIYEKKSGASGKRPRFEACLEYIREGDTRVITRLDRLARSTQPPSSTFLFDEKGCLFWLFGNCRENETGFNTPPNVFNDLAGQARGFCSRFHGNSQRAFIFPILEGPGATS
jgi:predicted site-specific integrase-resolvase